MGDRRFGRVLVLLFLAGCGAEQPDDTGDWRTFPWITPLSERVLEPGHAPVPFLAGEQRAAFVPGVRWVVRQKPLVGPPSTAVREVVAVDEEGATIRLHFQDDAGNRDEEVGQTETHIKWGWLVHEAQWPLDEVVIRRERITVPAGTFDCIRYDVSNKSAGGLAESFWFAKDVPIHPIRHDIILGGKRSPFELMDYRRP